MTEVKLRIADGVRCGSCGYLLAELITAPYRIVCRRCKQVNADT